MNHSPDAPANTVERRFQSPAFITRMRKARRHILLYLLLFVVAIVVIVPIAWIIASSFTARDNVWKNVLPFSWRAFWPEDFTLDAYHAIFQKDFGRALANTFFLGSVTVIVGIAVGATSGFAFARLTFRGKNLLFALVIFSFMIPADLTVIPSFVLVRDLGWLNTWQGLIVPGLANGIIIFLFRQFFAEIPQDLIDAPRVDGATWLQVFLKIILPVSKPALISAGVILFLGQWNNFFWPLLVAPTPELRVVQVAVSIIGVEQQINLWEQMFASSTLAMLVPVLLILPFQKYYVGGILGSGLKG